MPVTYRERSEPHIQWNHIDGPLLTCRDGSAHWLTLSQRLMLWLGLTTIEKLDEKYTSRNFL